MTSISFTSGQIMEIVDLLREKAEESHDEGDNHLSYYYDKMADQFTEIIDKLKELPGEKRVANLALMMP